MDVTTLEKMMALATDPKLKEEIRQRIVSNNATIEAAEATQDTTLRDDIIRAILKASRKRSSTWQASDQQMAHMNNMRHKAQSQAMLFAKHVGPMIQALKDEGHSDPRIASILNERGLGTSTGGDWSGSSVYNVLARYHSVMADGAAAEHDGAE